jgi:nicotinic acid mononucleotide adenylyltransferase
MSFLKASPIPTFMPGQSTAPAAERVAMERAAMASGGAEQAMSRPARVFDTPPRGTAATLDHHPRGKEYGFAIIVGNDIVAADMSADVLKRWAVEKGLDVS